MAEPAYYRVKFDDHNILAERTATTRVGLQQYTFPGTEPAHIILDMIAGIYNYPDKNVRTYVNASVGCLNSCRIYSSKNPCLS